MSYSINSYSVLITAFVGGGIMVGWMIGMMAGIVLVLLVYVGFRRKRSSGSRGNVIDLKANRKAKAISGRAQLKPEQACSKCGRKRKLTFYADDAGVVRGLCSDCKKELGRHQELYPV